MADQEQDAHDQWTAELDKAVGHWLDEEWDLCTPICKDMLKNLSLPDHHKAWCHLMLATDYRESDTHLFYHASMAEQIFWRMHESEPESEIQKKRYKLAKRVMDTASVNWLQTMHETHPDDAVIKDRYKISKAEFRIKYPDEPIDDSDSVSPFTVGKTLLDTYPPRPRTR